MYYKKSCARIHNITINLVEYQKYAQYKMFLNTQPALIK